MATKSLGTLTLDLVARTAGFVQGMDKAERQTKQWRRSVERDMQRVAKVTGAALGAAAVTAAAGLAVIVSRSRESIDALAKTADKLGVTTEGLASLRLAAEQTGVAQNQLDVGLQRFTRRLADAAAGTGPAVKAFETLGLSAQELVRLKPDVAFSRVADAMNALDSQTERVATAFKLFDSEGVGLVNTLALGSEGLADMAKKAEDAGLAITRIDAAKVEAANDAFNLAGKVIDGVGMQLTIALAPALETVADLFFDAAKEAGGLGSATESAVDQGVKAVAFLADAADGVGRAFDSVANIVVAALAGIAAGAAETAADILAAFSLVPGIDFSATEQSIRDFSKIQQGVFKEATDAIRDNLERPLSGNAIRDGYEQAKVSAQAAAEAAAAERAERNAGVDLVKRIVLEEVKVTAEKRKATAELKAAIAANEDYYRLVSDLRTEEEQINDVLRERLGIIEKFPGKDTGETRSRAIAAAAIEPPDVGGLDAAVGGPASELFRLNEESAALQEWYDNEIERYRSYLDEKLITQNEFFALEVDAKEKHEEQLAKIEQARRTASLVAAEAAFGDLADITRQFAGEQSTAYKVLFAIEKGAAIARSIVAIQTAIAQASTAGPFPANLAAMASVASATAGLVSTIASTTIQGQAHDGLMSVPKTGTYILEKGERVTTAETSAKLDRTLDNMGSGGNIRIVNSFDSGEVVGGFLGSSDGERAVMNIVRRNQQQIRSLSA